MIRGIRLTLITSQRSEEYQSHQHQECTRPRSRSTFRKQCRDRCSHPGSGGQWSWRAWRSTQSQTFSEESSCWPGELASLHIICDISMPTLSRTKVLQNRLVSELKLSTSDNQLKLVVDAISVLLL